jgi:hypothetical protein
MANMDAFNRPEDGIEWAFDQNAQTWGDEWSALEYADQLKVALDLLDSDRTAFEIQRSVFVGNLASYARSLR